MPLQQIMLTVGYKLHQAERNEVVEMIETGKLKPNNDSRLIQLPDDYAHLSKGGGEVLIEKNQTTYSILFFTYRGILDNFSGFLYIPNSKSPDNISFINRVKETERIDNKWYFVSSF